MLAWSVMVAVLLGTVTLEDSGPTGLELVRNLDRE